MQYTRSRLNSISIGESAVRKDRRSLFDATKHSSDGPRARAAKLSPERRSEIAREAALSRWGKTRNLEGAPDESAVEPEIVEEESDARRLSQLPEAKHRGVLRLSDLDEIPCYVLSD